jgi:hypothetical protein
MFRSQYFFLDRHEARKNDERLDATINAVISTIVVVDAAASTIEYENTKGLLFSIHPMGVDVGGPWGLLVVCHYRAWIVSLIMVSGPK